MLIVIQGYFLYAYHHHDLVVSFIYNQLVLSTFADKKYRFSHGVKQGTSYMGAVALGRLAAMGYN